LLAGLEALAANGTASPPSSARIELFALQAAEAVLGIASGATPTIAAPSPRDHKRISVVLRHMEETQDQPHSLDALAALACMSKYHFLRNFRRITGSTPYDYLLSLRLRRAAVRLRDSDDSIVAIAFDAGFGDLSTFNAKFKDVFRKTPGEWRRIRP
jgi:transcriptional regulator GlxA family with amidase domain